MKKAHQFYLMALILLGIGAFLSCNPEPVSPAVTGGLVSANMGNNEFFDSEEVVSNLFTSGADSTLEISASSADSDNITILIRNPQKDKIYSTSASVLNQVTFTFREFNNGITFTETTLSGDLVVTNYDLITRTMDGTFSFTTDGRTLTNGIISEVKF